MPRRPTGTPNISAFMPRPVNVVSNGVTLEHETGPSAIRRVEVVVDEDGDTIMKQDSDTIILSHAMLEELVSYARCQQKQPRLTPEECAP